MTAERHRDRGTPVSPAALARAWSDLLRPEYGGGVERSYVKHVFDGSRYVQAEHLPLDECLVSLLDASSLSLLGAILAIAPSWPLRRWLETASRTTGHLRLVLTWALNLSPTG